MKTDYKYDDIVQSLKDVGLKEGSIVSLKTDLATLGFFESKKKIEILESFYNAFDEVIDLDKGTIVVSTASMSLINTTSPFCLETTKSETGVLTEYIRQKKGAIRSEHPFESSCAIGKDASFFCNNNSLHGYGPRSPDDRLIEKNATVVSIGIEPRKSCSHVHHVEMVMGVPYRYNKEYLHPIKRGGKVNKEKFYRSVWYQDIGIKRDYCNKIFKGFYDNGYQTIESKLGRGSVYSYSIKDFFDSTSELMSKDMYIWLNEIPEKSPWRK